MDKFLNNSIKLGIVGGGQLGKMLATDASRWGIEVRCLDVSAGAPASSVCSSLSIGSLTSKQDVLQFGKGLDYLTVESDDVNAEALIELEASGVKTYPKGETLKIIQDKFLQREFCLRKNLPVPEFRHFSSKAELIEAVRREELILPRIVKTCKSGYDGKGVFSVKDVSDLEELPDTELLAEEVVDIKRELSVIVSRNSQGEVSRYPLVEFFMRENAYLVDYFISPAEVSSGVSSKLKSIAEELVVALNHVGVLAIEFFLDSTDSIFINECSPRPHNSGHHTIEGSFTSQYEQHLRCVLGLPLGSCEATRPAAVVNLLGDEGASGKAVYRGLEECLKLPGTKVHVYGKKETKPLRKMGHISILGEDISQLKERIETVKQHVRVGV